MKAENRVGQPFQLSAFRFQLSLALAAQHGLASVAFPSISTGIFGYPVEDAARVALAAVRDALADGGSVTLVRFVLWGERASAAYAQAAHDLDLTPKG